MRFLYRLAVVGLLTGMLGGGAGGCASCSGRRKSNEDEMVKGNLGTRALGTESRGGRTRGGEETEIEFNINFSVDRTESRIDLVTPRSFEQWAEDVIESGRSWVGGGHYETKRTDRQHGSVETVEWSSVKNWMSNGEFDGCLIVAHHVVLKDPSIQQAVGEPKWSWLVDNFHSFTLSDAFAINEIVWARGYPAETSAAMQLAVLFCRQAGHARLTRYVDSWARIQPPIAPRDPRLK
jgi:hypothetical protein